MKNDLFITYAGKVEFLTKVKDETNKKGKPYKIRSLAVNLNDTNPDYPVTLVFDVVGNDSYMKKLEMLEGITSGEEVVVTFTIKSNPYTNKEGENKYFLGLNLFKVEKAEDNQSPPVENLSQDPDDLPF